MCGVKLVGVFEWFRIRESEPEALQMAEKLLEYARFKGNEKLSLVLSKSTDLLREIAIRNQKQSSIYDFLNIEEIT